MQWTSIPSMGGKVAVDILLVTATETRKGFGLMGH